MPKDSLSAKRSRAVLNSATLETMGKATPVVFRPIWNVQKNYLCGYIIRLRTRVDHNDDESMAVTDIGLLLRGAQALSELQARGEKSVVVVPVSFGTLNSYPWRGHYLSMLRRIPEGVRGFIVLQIGNIPANAPKTRLRTIQGDVHGLCRAIAFTAGIEGGHLDCVSRQNVHACAIAIGQGHIESDDFIGTLNRFADKANGINCAAMADGIATRAALCAAVSAGFRYLAGEAVLADQQELGISRREFTLSTAFGAN